MDQYVRVSRVAGRSGESFISPDLQREQGAAWASSRGVEVVAVHEDLDQSGGKLERPGLDALMARIRSGQTDGVIVSKLDRLSRLGVADALRLVEQITDAGGSIAALDLGLDPTTPFGEFGMTIMLALARMERRRMSEAWEHAKTRALDRGARMGPTPFGYTRDDDGLLVAASEVGARRDAGVQARRRPRRRRGARVPAQASTGVPLGWSARRSSQAQRRSSDLERVHRAAAAAQPQLPGRDSLWRSLVRDSHPALVDRVTFERAHPGDEKPQRRPAAVFPLSGFATCANCGEFLIGARAGGNGGRGLRTYRCRASLASWKGERCDSPTNIMADRLEGYVVEQVKQAYEQAARPGSQPASRTRGARSRTFRASWRRRSASWSGSPPIRLRRNCLDRPRGRRLCAHEPNAPKLHGSSTASTLTRCARPRSSYRRSSCLTAWSLPS